MVLDIVFIKMVMFIDMNESNSYKYNFKIKLTSAEKIWNNLIRVSGYNVNTKEDVYVILPEKMSAALSDKQIDLINEGLMELNLRDCENLKFKKNININIRTLEDGNYTDNIAKDDLYSLFDRNSSTRKPIRRKNCNTF